MTNLFFTKLLLKLRLNNRMVQGKYNQCEKHAIQDNCPLSSYHCIFCMISGNIGQLVLCLYLIPFLKVLLDAVEYFYESFLSLVAPSRWRILVPLAAAFSLAEFNALKLATSYTPSSVRTTLKFRSGMIGSLHDPEFQRLRSAVDDSCFIFGAMFWGCLFSSTLILFTSFVIFGMLCFEPFLPAVLQIIAAIIGIGITILVKMLFLMLARRKFHKRAFYRENPFAANVIAVVLESWSLGITTLYVAKRMIFLLGASFIFVGKSQLLGLDTRYIGRTMVYRKTHSLLISTSSHLLH